MMSLLRTASWEPTRLQVSESAVEPLVCVAYLVPKEMGHFLSPEGEESSNQKPPEALVV